MKKLLAVIFAASLMFTLAGCSPKNKDKATVSAGAEEILAAKEMYRSLDSGKLNVINGETGETERIFTFKYTDRDMLNFSFEAVIAGGKYYEYYNGKSLTVNKGAEERTFKWPSSGFKKYKRGDTKTHPNASTGIFFYEPQLMKGLTDGFAPAEVIAEEGGITCYRYDYDMEKLSQYMNTVTGEGTMVSYVTEYRFNEGGEFVSLSEISALDSGKVYNYLMTVTDRNQIKEIYDLKNTPERQEIPEKPALKAPEE